MNDSTQITVIVNGSESTYVFDTPKNAAQLLASPAFQRQFGVSGTWRARVNGYTGREYENLSEGDTLELEPRAAEKG